MEMELELELVLEPRVGPSRSDRNRCICVAV
jgi:hypothetical protein